MFNLLFLRCFLRSGSLPGLLLGLTLLAAPARAQIVDDSTKVLYGPLTTRVVREEAVLRDQPAGQPLDTTLTTFHNLRHWLPDTAYYQDLGNLGTAARRLRWEPPTQLGPRLGRTAFDRYARRPSAVAYYDTRSPYTFFRYLQGGLGEQIFEFSHSRSFKQLANVGLAYERVASNKVLSTLGQQGLARHSTITLFGRYQSEDERYHLLANYRIIRHEVVEQGGIAPQNSLSIPASLRDTSLRQLFDYNLEQVRLSNALNRENRDEAHLAHTYRLLGKGFTAFHVLDFNRQHNRFTDDNLAQDGSYFAAIRLNPIKTEDRVDFRQVENQAGLLGHTTAVDYRAYARYRVGRLQTSSVQADGSTLPTQSETFNKVFLGGTAAFRYRQFAIETAGEYKLADEYWVRASARLGLLTAEVSSASVMPTLTELRYSGNHDAWDNTFRNTKVNQLLVRLTQKLGPHYLQAEGAVADLTDLVYYNAQGRPSQLPEARRLLLGRLRHQLTLGKFRADHDVTLTLGGNNAGLRQPAVVANSRLAYQGYLFKKALFGQVGLETFFTSRWRPYNYSPSTQQFYVQDTFTARSHPLADVFLSADIKSVTLFLKVAYANQGLYRKGYFTAPYYTGNPRSFQFGLKWNFFD